MATEYLIGNVKGIKGDKGEKGAIGLSPNLTIGTVTTGNAGTQANATITGTTPNLELSLTIPQGENGITPNNITGNAGTATKLETARKINGVDFDGTKDISIEKISTTIDLTALDINFYYPVRVFGSNLFEIHKPFYLGEKASTMLLTFEGTGQTGGSTASYLDMTYLSNSKLTKKVVQFWALGDETIFWLKGGNPYTLTSMVYTPFIIYTESTIIHNGSKLVVEPESVNVGVIPIKNGRYGHSKGITYKDYILDGLTPVKEGSPLYGILPQDYLYEKSVTYEDNSSINLFELIKENFKFKYGIVYIKGSDWNPDFRFNRSTFLNFNQYGRGYYRIEIKRNANEELEQLSSTEYGNNANAGFALNCINGIITKTLSSKYIQLLEIIAVPQWADSETVKTQLQSTAVGQGASLIGISDTANNFVSTNVEGALLELANKVKALENK